MTQPPLKRASMMPDSSVKRYDAGHVFIVDDRDPGATAKKGSKIMRKITEHEANCDIIRLLFGEHTDYEVHRVFFKSGTTQNGILQFWKDEVKKLGSGDLMIVYFEGNAGYTGREYSWKFKGYPKGDVNAYNIIDTINESEVDCLFILDCFFPTRFAGKWKREHASTEIIACGAKLQDPDGRSAGDNGGFTDVLVEVLDDFVGGIDDEEKYQSHIAKKSILELLARNKEMCSNPLRLWLGKTKRDGKTMVKRFVIDPVQVRETGKLEIFGVTIQSKDGSTIAETLALQKDANEAENMSGDRFDDEGLADMVEGNATLDSDCRKLLLQ